MAEKFKAVLVTPKGVVLDKEVEEVVAPGILGEFGVLIGHTPMLTFIKPGVFSYLENDKFTKFAVGAGFCEVLKDAVSILVDEAYTSEEIDPKQAEAELAALQQQLSQADSAADPQGFEQLTNKVKVAQAKVSLAGS
jgi:F-type H+-transporting ATPase subunit epsilon